MKFKRSPERENTRANRFLVSRQGVENNETAIQGKRQCAGRGRSDELDLRRVDLKSRGFKT